MGRRNNCKNIVSRSTLSARYTGYRVSSDNTVLDTVDASIDPQIFYDEYISRRVPCIVTGDLVGMPWLTDKHRWTNEYMKRNAGDADIEVEQRASSAAPFGRTAPKVQIKYRDFLDSMTNHNDSYYLTTQPIPEDENGPTLLAASPIRELLADQGNDVMNTTPKLFGHMVVHQLNMWMGYNKNGSSSGLHHDFHDNLYVLLRGKKRFTLYAPSDAEALYVRGKINRIHPNGLINYVGVDTRDDGAHPESVLEIGEKYLDHLNAKIQSLHGDKAQNNTALQVLLKQHDEAENAIEKALDRLMTNVDRSSKKNKRKGANVDEDNDVDDDDDDYDDDNDFALVDDYDDMNDDGDERSDSDSSNPKNKKKRKKPFQSNASDNVVHAHFCNVHPYETCKSSAEHGLFKYAKAIICTIESGQMLYLPASWFHEVTSFTTKIDEGHLAFNFWMNPPSSDGTFLHPYVDDHWVRRNQLLLASTLLPTTTTPTPTSTNREVKIKSKKNKKR